MEHAGEDEEPWERGDGNGIRRSRWQSISISWKIINMV